MMNKSVSKSIFIDGKMYEFHQLPNFQGPQLNTNIVHLIGNLNEQFILKQYNQIENNEIDVLKQIKRQQNEIKPKCQNIIKIIGMQEKTIQNQMILQIIIEKSKDNCLLLMNQGASINIVQKLRIFEQMVKGVIELHDLGSFIKDLKPENFVYFEDNNNNYKVKLIEFGFLNQDSTPNSLSKLRSFKYMAPEVLLAYGIYNNTTDIWSLGIILYQLLSSQDFFKAMNQQELIEQMKVLSQEQINIKINQTLNIGQPEKDLISKMLQKEIKNRINLESLLEKISMYLPTIQEQEEIKQLKFEKDQYQSFLKVANEQWSSYSSSIQIISEKFKFYQCIYQQFQGQEKISFVLKLNQDIAVAIQQLVQQESLNQQFNSNQHQISLYQEFNRRLKQILQDCDKLKNSIRDSNQSIQSIDKIYLDQHHLQIDDFNKKLNDNQIKFQSFSQYQKYANEIIQSIQQIDRYFVQLNTLKQLIAQRTQQAYSEYSQSYSKIKQQLTVFCQQNDLMIQQIHNEYQIEQRNAERIKKLKMVESQFNLVLNSMVELKYQITNQMNNQFYQSQSNKQVMEEKLRDLDQKKSEYQNQFDNFNKFNQLDSYQVINWQIQLLENFSKQLKDLEIKEKISVGSLVNYEKNVQEKDHLNNELQKKYSQFQQALQSINFQLPNKELYYKINEQNEKHHQQLEQEIKTLQEYSNLQHENEKLFIEVLQNQELKKKSQRQQELEKRLKKQQQTNKQKGQILDDVLKRVSKKQSELNFTVLDDNLMNDQEQLNVLDKKLQIEVNIMNQKTSNQQLNLQQLSELKEGLTQVYSKIDDLMMKTSSNTKIQEFTNTFQQNLESYEKQYALVNYIKQYHLTRYIERIKIIVNQQDQVEITKQEKEAQDILQRYENYLFNNRNKITIEAMERDRVEVQKQLEKLENILVQQNLEKLCSKLNFQQSVIENNWNNQFYKITEFTQMLRLYKIQTEIKEAIQQEQSNPL